MKYVVYKYCAGMFDFTNRYERVELKDDAALKDYLFENYSDLKNIEIFDASNKKQIGVEIKINNNLGGIKSE